MWEAVKTHVGPRATGMIEIARLATRPDRQGHGYGSALVRVATTRVCPLPCFDVCHCEQGADIFALGRRMYRAGHAGSPLPTLSTDDFITRLGF